MGQTGGKSVLWQGILCCDFRKKYEQAGVIER